MCVRVVKSKVAVSIASGLVVLGAMVTPAFASTSAIPSSPNGSVPASQSRFSPIPITAAQIQAVKSVKVSVVNGHLSIDPATITSNLDSTAVAQIQNGVALINSSIDSGYMKIENGKAVLTDTSNRINPAVSVTSDGWWGADLYFNQAQTQNEIAALNNTGDVWSFAALVAGILGPIPVLGEVSTAIAVITAGITALGAFVIANDMSAADHGYGVTLCVRTWGAVWFDSGYVVS